MDIPGSAITHKTNIYPSTKCPDGQGKKNEAGIHSPDGQKEGKKNEAGIQGPDGQGKTKRRYPRSRWTKKYVFLLKKGRYPWPRWAKEKKKSRYPQPRWANLEEKEEEKEGKTKTN